MFRDCIDPRALLFMLALTWVTGLYSIQAQTANRVVAPRERSAAIADDDFVLAGQAIAVLEELRENVLAYESLHEFESGRRLAHVPLETFIRKLNEATCEIESILAQMPDTKLKTHLRNSLHSYRDGAFWWAKVVPQKVINTRNLALAFTTTMPAERFMASTTPYTVAIHWRHAHRSLLRARTLMRGEKTRLR